MVYTDRTEEVIRALKERKEHWRRWRHRVMEIDYLVKGEWGAIFPNDVDQIDLPMVENLFQLTVEDGGRLFAELMPTSRVDPEGLKPTHTAKAETRERVLAAYDNVSEIFDHMEFFGQDMVATGLSAIKIWPQMKLPAEKRFPKFQRVDPRLVLPEPRWAPHQPTDSVIVNYTEPLSRLLEEFPIEVGALMLRIAQRKGQRQVGPNVVDLRRYDKGAIAGKPAELQVVDWYSREYVCRVIVYEDEEHFDGEEVLAIPNPTGYCPIQLAARNSWTQEPKGQLDDAKGPMRTKNRFYRILFDYFIDMVYGGKLAWNVKNPYDKGPGVIYHALSPDAKMEPITPQNVSFQVLQTIGLLDDAARTSAVAPRSREGDVELNKATAAFLTRAQGQLTSVVRSLQRSWASAKRRANEAAFAQDEYWCDATKTISGRARGRRFRTSYRPSRDIAGEYANRVSYGTTSGQDLATHNVFMLQKRGNRDMSRVTYMEQDPTIEDVDGELQKLRIEAIEDSILAGLMLPDTPLAQRVQIGRLLAEGKPLGDIVEAVMNQPQPALAAPGGPPALGAGGGAAAAARPGVAEAEAPGPLMPIGEIRELAKRRRG